MLGQHLDGLVLGHRFIQVVADFGKEGIEGDTLSTVWPFDQALYAADMPLGDLRDIRCPIFPVVPLAAALDDLGHDRLGELVESKGGLEGALLLRLTVACSIGIIFRRAARTDVGFGTIGR